MYYLLEDKARSVNAEETSGENWERLLRAHCLSNYSRDNHLFNHPDKESVRFSSL